eukprot:TRINITY_DN42063_c0_g1_i1.p1 TRINITY_DN42063_c0_g1~~TRINITY_DN42063_c0_g1_i1.p1  ORF type:complete len:1507 (-),score=268.50 TRINITY_DN42063_c0_g1_i1:258-4292(-)
MAVVAWSSQDVAVVRGAFAFAAQVSDSNAVEWIRWGSASRRTLPTLRSRGKDVEGVDEVEWRRLVIIYQMPGVDVVSSSGIQSAKAVEDKLRALPGWKKLCGEVQPSLQALCQQGDSLVSASYGTMGEVLAAEAQQGVAAKIKLDGNGSKVLIDLQSLLTQYREHSFQTLQRWLPGDYDKPDYGGSQQIKGFRSSFSFALTKKSAGAPWRDFVLNEAEETLLAMGALSPRSEDQARFRAYMLADDVPSLQDRELQRAVVEDALGLVSFSLAAFVASLVVTRRLLVALSVLILAFTVPSIVSVGLLGTAAADDAASATPQVKIISFAAWFIVAAGLADLSMAIVRAIEQRRDSLRPFVPECVMVSMLATEQPNQIVFSEPKQKRAFVTRTWRFFCEALSPTCGIAITLLTLSTPDLEMIGVFGRHAGCGLLLATPLAVLLVLPAVEFGDIIAVWMHARRDESEWEPWEVLKLLMDYFMPYEFGIQSEWTVKLRVKVQRTARDILRMPLVRVLVPMFCFILLIILLPISHKPIYTAATPQLYVGGHRLYDMPLLFSKFQPLPEPAVAMKDRLEVATRCTPSAHDDVGCIWHHCEAGQTTAAQTAADAATQSQCKCWKQESNALNCHGSAARLWGLSSEQASTLLGSGSFWTWVAEQLRRAEFTDITYRKGLYLEVETWQTGLSSVEPGYSTYAGTDSWQSSCLQVMCFCSDMQCEMNQTFADTKSFASFDYTSPLSGANSSKLRNTTANSSVLTALSGRPALSQNRSVFLTVAWGITISQEPLGTGLDDRGVTFNGIELDDLGAQRHLLAFCEGTPPNLVVLNRGCWPIEFRSWLEKQSLRYPVPKAQFYSSLRKFFEEQAISATWSSLNLTAHQGDIGSGFWLTSDGKAQGLVLTFEVPEDESEPGSGIPKDLTLWESYIGLRNGRSPSTLGNAWLAPFSTAVAKGLLATAATVDKNAWTVSVHLVMWPSLWMFLMTWAVKLSVVAAVLNILCIMCHQRAVVSLAMDEVGVLEIIGQISFMALISLALLRVSQQIVMAQDGPGKDPAHKKKRQTRHQKVHRLSALLAKDDEGEKHVGEGEKKRKTRKRKSLASRFSFKVRSVSIFASNVNESLQKQEEKARKATMKEMSFQERKDLVKQLEVLNGPGLFHGGLRHERLGRTTRGLCRAAPATLSCAAMSLVCVPWLATSSMVGIVKVCWNAFTGAWVSLLLSLVFLPVFSVIGLGPSRVKGRAYSYFVWWLWRRRPKPDADGQPAGLLDTDLGTLGVAAAKVLGWPFLNLSMAEEIEKAALEEEFRKDSVKSDADQQDEEDEEGLTIKGLDVQGATAMPPFHIVMAVKDKFEVNG